MKPADHTRLKLLVVDDEPAVLESIARLLTHLGHVVQTAGSGEAALDLMAKDGFDLVITDYFMPGMKGDELARHLKQRHPGLPILMVTAYADIFQADRRHAGLVDHLLSKPFDIPQLQQAIALARSMSAGKGELAGEKG